MCEELQDRNKIIREVRDALRSNFNYIEDGKMFIKMTPEELDNYFELRWLGKGALKETNPKTNK